MNTIVSTVTVAMALASGESASSRPPQERGHSLGLFDELVVGYRAVFDDPLVGVHIEKVLGEQQGAAVLVEPWSIHDK